MRKLFDYFKLLYTNFGKGKRYSREDTISGNTVYENHQRVMKKAQNIIVFGNIIVPMGYGFCILVVIENCNHHLFCVPLVGAHIMIIIMHRPIGDY